MKDDLVHAAAETDQPRSGQLGAEEYDYEDLPHPEIRQLVDKLERGVEGLDEQVFIALKRQPETALPTAYLAAALALVPENWWWHMSHLEASIIPTSAVAGMEGLLSNAGAYDKQGRPISYRSMAHYDRGQLPRAICAALLKAVYNLPAAYGVQAKATEDEPKEIIEARRQRIASFRDRASPQREGDRPI